MHARVSTFQGPVEGIDVSLKHAETEILPAARTLDGFKGMLVLVDRTAGTSIAVTLWRDEEAMRTSEEAANRLRRQGAEAGGDQIVSVDRYEVGLFDLED